MKNFNANSVIQRITQIRKDKYGNRGKSKFARDLGISPSTYNYYEEDRVPPADILVKMCMATLTDINWLLTGESTDEQKTDSRKGRVFYDKKAPYKLFSSKNASVLQQLDDFFSEYPEMIEPTLGFIDLLCQKANIEKKPAESKKTEDFFENDDLSEKFVPDSSNQKEDLIPVLGRTAAGIIYSWDDVLGTKSDSEAVTTLSKVVEENIGKEIIRSVGCEINIDLQHSHKLNDPENNTVNLIQLKPDTDTNITEFLKNSSIKGAYPDSFALRVDGDSMSPRINDNDLLILSPSVPAKQGQVCVAKVKNQIGVTCKLIRETQESFHLIPVNEKYETKVIPKDELEWSLAILYHIKIK
ncbi:MAG: helix-turn-helix domain-containing protein [Planctomycetes bacterium]|nr:helix-turn-helix domain-containing protein [Planctomycetota bacterium]MBL7107358.1 helix-turn-helix domain-containing protein [Phycisphaerae bacterium]